MSSRLARAANKLISSDSLDLYILALAAFVFTLLGTVNIASITTLASVILGVLAALALSQIRSRRQVSELAAASKVNPQAILLSDFPEDLHHHRSAAMDYLYIGTAMARTYQSSSHELRQSLRNGARIRVVVIDPTEESLVREAAFRSPDPADTARIERRVRTTLEELMSLKRATGGNLQVRVAPFVPTANLHVIDPGRPTGIILAQHYQHRAQAEPAPMLLLKNTEGFWFQHYLQEAERIWEDAKPWPLPRHEQISRFARLGFAEDFGLRLIDEIITSSSLLITGISRNTLVSSNYNKLEARLRGGCAIRFLLMDPESEFISIAADRYYAERSPETLKERIRHTLRFLCELKRSTSADLVVRLTKYPLSMGMVAIDHTPGLAGSNTAIFVEYYAYRVAGEPKFVMRPVDGFGFENLSGEAEALWDSAVEYNLG